MYAELEDIGRLRFTRRLPHPPEKVWAAITEPEHLAAWFPTTIDGERRAGAPLRFEFRTEKLPGFDGVMVACQPYTLLEFDWGPDRLRIELRADGAGTVLTLIATFPEYGKAARDAAGWHVCLARLAGFLDKGEPVDGPDHRRISESYAARFGPKASTVGPPEGM
jgi:uncharacterized protein YndB with AHSA1/START domain